MDILEVLVYFRLDISAVYACWNDEVSRNGGMLKKAAYNFATVLFLHILLFAKHVCLFNEYF